MTSFAAADGGEMELPHGIYGQRRSLQVASVSGSKGVGPQHSRLASMI